MTTFQHLIGNMTTQTETVIKWGWKEFQVPEGFRTVVTCDTQPGDMVYIVGTKLEQPFAYGPFTVVDGELKTLKNSRGKTLTEPTSHWLVKE
jgi:hypothetical protein